LSHFKAGLESLLEEGQGSNSCDGDGNEDVADEDVEFAVSLSESGDLSVKELEKV
jgi:hypothetical protein